MTIASGATRDGIHWKSIPQRIAERLAVQIRLTFLGAVAPKYANAVDALFALLPLYTSRARPFNHLSRSNLGATIDRLLYVRTTLTEFLRARNSWRKMEYKWNARAVFTKGRHRKRSRAIPFPFYWNNCYAEPAAKHRPGENSIGRYSTSSPCRRSRTYQTPRSTKYANTNTDAPVEKSARVRRATNKIVCRIIIFCARSRGMALFVAYTYNRR